MKTNNIHIVFKVACLPCQGYSYHALGIPHAFYPEPCLFCLFSGGEAPWK